MFTFEINRNSNVETVLQDFIMGFLTLRTLSLFVTYSSPASLETSQSITMSVVNAVADCEGVAPTDLPPIHEQINTDALDNLIAHRDSEHASGGTQVTFDYYGYEVTVTDDKHVHVRDIPQ